MRPLQQEIRVAQTAGLLFRRLPACEALREPELQAPTNSQATGSWRFGSASLIKKLAERHHRHAPFSTVL